MKKLICSGLLMCSLQMFAQKSFEGIVTYKFLEAAGKKKMNMEVYFGKQKIKVILKDSASTRNGKDDLLIDLAKGIVHHFNSRKKTYRTDSLNTNNLEAMPAVTIAKEKNKAILNYHSTAYTGLDSAKSDFMGPMNFTIWYADSLYFPFDKKYANADMLPMFGNGSTIAMGMQMDMGKTTFQTSLEITPVSIKIITLPDSIFSIPADYCFREYQLPVPDSVREAADSLVNAAKKAADLIIDKARAMADSSAKVLGRKNAVKKSMSQKLPKQNTVKQPVKTPATKPKE